MNECGSSSPTMTSLAIIGNATLCSATVVFIGPAKM